MSRVARVVVRACACVCARARMSLRVLCLGACRRVAKLVRLKRLLELTKQKRKAEALGIDPDAFEELQATQEQQAAEAAEAAAAAAAAAEARAARRSPDEFDDAPTDEILAMWRAEGLDANGKEIDELERKVQDLEDSLGGDVTE